MVVVGRRLRQGRSRAGRKTARGHTPCQKVAACDAAASCETDRLEGPQSETSRERAASATFPSGPVRSCGHYCCVLLNTSPDRCLDPVRRLCPRIPGNREGVDGKHF